MAIKKPVKKAAKGKAVKVPWKGGSTPVKKAAAKKAAPPAKAKKGPVMVQPKNVKMESMLTELFKLNKLTRKAAAKLDEAKSDEQVLRDDIQALFGKTKLNSVSHSMGNVAMVETKYWVVEDMKKLLLYAKKPGNADILSVGLNAAAAKERLLKGVNVPGIKQDKRNDLRVTPAKSGK